MRSISWFIFLLAACCPLYGTENPGKILYLIQQGQHKQAFGLYRDYSAENGHDFDLLHQIGLALLTEGFNQSDPETQVLALYGATVSANDEAFYILEESMQSRYPQVQLLAIQALSRYSNDRTDQLFIRAMASNQLLIRLAALHQLCLHKHPRALAQTESLMYKTPVELLNIYPQLLAIIGNEKATKMLRRMFQHPSSEVRLAAILSAAKYKRDDLLPQIRQQAGHVGFVHQEACAYALGLFKDESSVPLLNKLLLSQYPTVVLAAQKALLKLGHNEEIAAICDQAAKGDLFAIAALNDVPEGADTLLALSKNKDVEIRINAAMALLALRDGRCFKALPELVIRDQRDLAFAEWISPGHAHTAWKVVSSANQLLKDDIDSYVEHLELKESILTQARDLSEDQFLILAALVLEHQQNELIPVLIALLEEMETPQTIELLKTFQQKLGAPLVRQYCNLALYRLNEPGPYGDQLRLWVKNQIQQALIQFRPFVPWEIKRDSHELTPTETSGLLIQAFEAFASHQDAKGIEVLIEAIESGHSKNKYALAGLLLRATQ